DVAAVATLLVDQSTQDQLVRDIEVTLAQPALNVLFTIEVRADFSARTALADGFGIAACPQHQGERVNQNGFTSAGLSGKNREAGVEINRGLIHDHKVSNVQGTEHRGLFVFVVRQRDVIPAQLLTQGGKKAVALGMDKANGVLGATHVNAVSLLTVRPGLHVKVHAATRFHPAQGRNGQVQGACVG